jgi:hypothetical protein
LYWSYIYIYIYIYIILCETKICPKTFRPKWSFIKSIPVGLGVSLSREFGVDFGGVVDVGDVVSDLEVGSSTLGLAGGQIFAPFFQVDGGDGEASAIAA